MGAGSSQAEEEKRGVGALPALKEEEGRSGRVEGLPEKWENLPLPLKAPIESE